MASASPRVPSAVLEQVRAMAAVAERAEDFFRTPSVGPALTAHQAGIAKNLRRVGMRALRHLPSRPLGAWPRLIRFLADAASELGWAVEETARFELPASEAPLQKIAALLKEASEELLKEMRRPGRGEPALLEAKRRAGEAERLIRKARGDWAERPEVVMGLKASGVCSRLARSAESLQDAADLLGEISVSLL